MSTKTFIRTTDVMYYLEMGSHGANAAMLHFLTKHYPGIDFSFTAAHPLTGRLGDEHIDGYCLTFDQDSKLRDITLGERLGAELYAWLDFITGKAEVNAELINAYVDLIEDSRALHAKIVAYYERRMALQPHTWQINDVSEAHEKTLTERMPEVVEKSFELQCLIHEVSGGW